MIESFEPGTWKELEQWAGRLLKEAGLEIQFRPRIRLARGKAQVDLLAIDHGSSPVQVTLVECKLWRRRVTQAQVHAFRTVVTDAGANGGILISARGFQPGAREAAHYSNVRLVTWLEFEALFASRWTENTLRNMLSFSFDGMREYTSVYYFDEREQLRNLSDRGLAAFTEWLAQACPLVGLADYLARPTSFSLPGMPRQPEELLSLPLSEGKETCDLKGIPASLLQIRTARAFLYAILEEKNRLENELEGILTDRPASAPLATT